LRKKRQPVGHQNGEKKISRIPENYGGEEEVELNRGSSVSQGAVEKLDIELKRKRRETLAAKP